MKEEVTNLLEEDTLPPAVKIAPPFPEELRNVWFTDASAKREGKEWKYRAVAINVDTKREIITKGEGSAQVGELVAVCSVFNSEGKAGTPVCIHTDSFAVFRGCTEWLPLWERNNWEVNRVPVWQKERWQEIVGVAKHGDFTIAWVPSHQEGSALTSDWNNRAGELARIAPCRRRIKQEKIGVGS
ncbi:ribonuclease H-like [Phalacrocorax aristotelis]|uniref:ribonuclease H-like n=1 Tax=Phalacrocorax aristotelis TaxID=126867 RepID=UPI003F4B7AC7